MTDSWEDPKSMVPRSTALWEWYRVLSNRLRAIALNEECACAEGAISSIADEIDEHAAEMEYQCRI